MASNASPAINSKYARQAIFTSRPKTPINAVHARDELDETSLAPWWNIDNAMQRENNMTPFRKQRYEPLRWANANLLLDEEGDEFLADDAFATPAPRLQSAKKLFGSRKRKSSASPAPSRSASRTSINRQRDLTLADLTPRSRRISGPRKSLTQRSRASDVGGKRLRSSLMQPAFASTPFRDLEAIKEQQSRQSITPLLPAFPMSTPKRTPTPARTPQSKRNDVDGIATLHHKSKISSPRSRSPTRGILDPSATVEESSLQGRRRKSRVSSVTVVEPSPEEEVQQEDDDLHRSIPGAFDFVPSDRFQPSVAEFSRQSDQARSPDKGKELPSPTSQTGEPSRRRSEAQVLSQRKGLTSRSSEALLAMASSNDVVSTTTSAVIRGAELKAVLPATSHMPSAAHVPPSNQARRAGGTLPQVKQAIPKLTGNPSKSQVKTSEDAATITLVQAIPSGGPTALSRLAKPTSLVPRSITNPATTVVQVNDGGSKNTLQQSRTNIQEISTTVRPRIRPASPPGKVPAAINPTEAMRRKAAHPLPGLQAHVSHKDISARRTESSSENHGPSINPNVSLVIAEFRQKVDAIISREHSMDSSVAPVVKGAQEENRPRMAVPSTLAAAPVHTKVLVGIQPPTHTLKPALKKRPLEPSPQKLKTEERAAKRQKFIVAEPRHPPVERQRVKTQTVQEGQNRAQAPSDGRIEQAPRKADSSRAYERKGMPLVEPLAFPSGPSNPEPPAAVRDARPYAQSHIPERRHTSANVLRPQTVSTAAIAANEDVFGAIQENSLEPIAYSKSAHGVHLGNDILESMSPPPSPARTRRHHQVESLRLCEEPENQHAAPQTVMQSTTIHNSPQRPKRSRLDGIIRPTLVDYEEIIREQPVVARPRRVDRDAEECRLTIPSSPKFMRTHREKLQEERTVMVERAKPPFVQQKVQRVAKRREAMPPVAAALLAKLAGVKADLENKVSNSRPPLELASRKFTFQTDLQLAVRRDGVADVDWEHKAQFEQRRDLWEQRSLEASQESSSSSSRPVHQASAQQSMRHRTAGRSRNAGRETRHTTVNPNMRRFGVEYDSTSRHARY